MPLPLSHHPRFLMPPAAVPAVGTTTYGHACTCCTALRPGQPSPAQPVLPPGVLFGLPDGRSEGSDQAGQSDASLKIAGCHHYPIRMCPFVISPPLVGPTAPRHHQHGPPASRQGPLSPAADSLPVRPPLLSFFHLLLFLEWGITSLLVLGARLPDDFPALIISMQVSR